jgi:hypothetical protein
MPHFKMSKKIKTKIAAYSPFHQMCPQILKKLKNGACSAIFKMCKRILKNIFKNLGLMPQVLKCAPKLVKKFS